MSIKTPIFLQRKNCKDCFCPWDGSPGITRLNSSHVISAWDDNKLIGLVRALDDGETVAFLHYLLVDPAYQGHHIGDELMKKIMSCFENLLYVKIMPSDPKMIAFYERYGFQQYDNYSAMVLKHFR